MRAAARRPARGAFAGRPGECRVALYSHDTMGIGHMRRNLLIAQALAVPPVSATVLLIAGAREAGAFALPVGVDCLTLPSLSKDDDGQYRSRSLGLSLRELTGLRARTITAALAAFAPDVLVVDKEPRGAVGELDAALADLRERGQTRCVLGLRDVLDAPATVRRQWRAAGNEKAVRDYYDAVWVYGDPGVYDLARECRFSPAVRAKLTFTGYLDPCVRLRGAVNGAAPDACGCEAPIGPYVLCLVGGGQDGARLAEAFAATELPRRLTGVIVTGPFMPADARDRLRELASENPRLRVMEFLAEPCRLVRGAERVVAMGGYNTVSEILGFEKPALIVPRVKPRQEQLIRAERLRELGLLDVLLPDEVTPAALRQWLRRDAASPQVRGRIDLNGTARLPALLRAVRAGVPARSFATEFTHATP